MNIENANENNMIMEDPTEGSVIIEEDEEGRSTSNDGESGPGTTTSDSSNSIQIAKAETKAVARSKIVVYSILVFLAIATAIGVWYYVTVDETKEFEDRFTVYAEDIFEGVNDKAHVVIQQLSALSATITSHAIDTGEMWPYVAVPHFYLWAQYFGDLMGSSLILFSPVVNISETEKWLEFVRTDPDILMTDPNDPVQPKVETVDYIQRAPDNLVKSTNMDLLPDETLMLPIIQYGPNANSTGLMNMDLLTHPIIQRAFKDTQNDHDVIITGVTDLFYLAGYTHNRYPDPHEPRSMFMAPVFDSHNEANRSMIGVVSAVIAWKGFFQRSRPADMHDLSVILYDSCGDKMTFSIQGNDVEYLAQYDVHDKQYDSMARTAKLSDFTPLVESTEDNYHCDYSIAVYPSEAFESDYHTSKPFLFAAMLVAVFLVTSCVFIIYDWLVGRRQMKVMGAAQRTTAIVQSLFPKTVGERLIEEAAAKDEKGRLHAKNAKHEMFFSAQVDQSNRGTDQNKSDPIADLFPATTIMFADIVGFTAWSSTREPKQVFTLLETIYQEFDTLATRRHVFKVETVGDCYVAVAGLPDPRPDHAVVMARFARDCMYRFQALCPQLELDLGPETADLAIRVGLHSGPVTGGVLRSARARFQLFGDTMNTASRMESTGRPHKIQISQETADLINEAKKGHWCQKRIDLVDAKGKGKLQTFWLELDGAEGSSSSGQSIHEKEHNNNSDEHPAGKENNFPEDKESKHIAFQNETRDKEVRLIRWNVEILTKLLLQVKERRLAARTKADSPDKIHLLERAISNKGGLAFEEVVDIIKLPPYKVYAPKVKKTEQSQKVELSEVIKEQLQNFVTEVASNYHRNPFHSFEHASHVAMSVVKLMSRIIAPALSEADGATLDRQEVLHDHTYGITSDPMTQFTCALAAVIHDLDHTGVPNATLIREKNPLAIRYKDKSVAEQNSVDLAWILLMQECYKDLRLAIYTNQAEVKRFRQLLVNTVMATDIVDKDLNSQRRKRWTNAFSEGASIDTDYGDTVNRKATIVLEHLIQASDVAHTMQHFQIYRKWNSRFFQENYRAYKQGRAEKDPSESWYQGEIGFFEFYIIPLAKQLKNCGVFGVSSDEYLTYAIRNKQEWTARGQQLVEEFKEEALRAFEEEAEIEENLEEVPSMAKNDADDGEEASQYKQENENFKDEEPFSPGSNENVTIQI